MSSSLASIVVNNFNYESFVAAAIDSALAQTYSNTEVVVVDDGSTDSSRGIIARYADRITPVFKDNGGQASAFTAGLRASRGQVIIFLDADDTLCPTAVETAMPYFVDSRVVKVHWPLRIIDADGKAGGETLPPSSQLLPDGDLRELVLQNGPDSYLSSPSSGNAWSRAFLEQVLPAPREHDYRQGADGYLITVAPLFGFVRASREPLGNYRVHGRNQFWSGSMDKRIQGSLARYDRRHRSLVQVIHDLGWQSDVDSWKERNAYFQWMRTLDLMLEELKTHTLPTQTVILVDENQCGGSNALGDRRVVPFLEREGEYWGIPQNDAMAINELERMRHEGASVIALGWPAFWWLEHFAEFRHYLDERNVCIFRNERLIIYELVEPESNCK